MARPAAARLAGGLLTTDAWCIDAADCAACCRCHAGCTAGCCTGELGPADSGYAAAAAASCASADKAPGAWYGHSQHNTVGRVSKATQCAAHTLIDQMTASPTHSIHTCYCRPTSPLPTHTHAAAPRAAAHRNPYTMWTALHVQEVLHLLPTCASCAAITSCSRSCRKLRYCT